MLSKLIMYKCYVYVYMCVYIKCKYNENLDTAYDIQKRYRDLLINFNYKSNLFILYQYMEIW